MCGTCSWLPWILQGVCFVVGILGALSNQEGFVYLDLLLSKGPRLLGIVPKV